MLCITCGVRPRVKDRASCQICLDRGKIYRLNHKRDRREYLKQWRTNKKRLGLCIVCGIRKVSKSRLCNICWNRASKWKKHKYKTSIQNGICIRCGEPSKRHKCQKCYEYDRELNNKLNRDIKLEVMSYYGRGTPMCNCCDEKFVEFLTIDHVNNDGAKQRRSQRLTGPHLYKWIKKHNYPTVFQVLCWNCQWSKHLHGKCTHPAHKSLKIAK